MFNRLRLKIGGAKHFRNFSQSLKFKHIHRHFLEKLLWFFFPGSINQSDCNALVKNLFLIYSLCIIISPNQARRWRNEWSFRQDLILYPSRGRKQRTPGRFTGYGRLSLNEGASSFGRCHHLGIHMWEVQFRIWRNLSEDGDMCFYLRRFGPDLVESKNDQSWKL